MPQGSLFKSLTSEAWRRDWLLLLAAKILLAIFLPFFSDEAYYWVWSHNLKLSYFDHPPFIAWLFLLGQPFDSFQFAARIPAVLIGHFTIWIWCAHIAKEFLPTQKRMLFWILSLHTLVGFGSVVANPDIPFLFFWSLSVLFFMRSLEKLSAPVWPILLGISLGLGFCSKYLMALFVPVAFAYLILSGQWRNLRWTHVILPVLFGALFSSPVLIWNYLNDWSSFKFQIDHGLGKPWDLRWTGDFLLGTFFLLFPPFVYLFLKNKIFKKFADFNVLLFLLLIFFFVYTTTGGDTELNWPLALYPSFFFAIVPYLKTRKLYLSFVTFFGLIGITLLGFALVGATNSPHSRLTEGSVYKKIYSQSQQFKPLYTSTYQSASYFWFLSKTPVYKLRHSSRHDEFDSMAASNPSEEIFYFLKEEYQPIPEQQKERYAFERVALLDHNFEVYKVIKKK